MRTYARAQGVNTYSQYRKISRAYGWGGIRCSEGVGDFLTTTSSSSKEVEDLLSTGPPPVMLVNDFIVAWTFSCNKINDFLTTGASSSKEVDDMNLCASPRF